LLFTWGIWAIRNLRIIFVVLNALVLFSAPYDGGHYLTDMLGGVVVALASISMIYMVYPKKNNLLPN